MASEFKKKEEIKVVDSTPEKLNEFGREQLIYICQYCEKKVLTEIEHQTTWIGIGLSIIFFLIFRVYSLPLIVMLIPLTQQTVHTCPNCLNNVGTRSFYDIISLSDKVITYNIGNFGIIITKKQILAIFVFLLFGIIFYLFFSNLSIGRGNFIKETWEDFKNDCGKERFSNNAERAEIICKSKYKYSDVMWNGYIIRVDYNENFFARFRLSILVKMERSQDEEPDIYLKFTEYQYDQFKSDIFNISRGDSVSFNATVIFEGDEKNIPVLETFGFEKLNEHIFIEPHIHHNGRYSVPHEETIHKDNQIYKDIPNLVSDEELTIDQKETYH